MAIRNMVPGALTRYARTMQVMKVMKSMMSVVKASLLLVALVPMQSVVAGAGDRRVALVIGNAAYEKAPLENPVRDAAAMSERLRELGFAVYEARDATLKQMQQTLLEFVADIDDGATAMVFYAGHGIQANGRNYLMPVDAGVSSEAALRFEAMELNDVLEALEGSGSRINIVVLDACRNNPFERKYRGGSRGLAVVDAAAGTLIAYATAPGQVASDGDGVNGLYTHALLDVLDEPNLKVEEVFKRVRARVAEQSDNRQMPWESSSLLGDFVFNPVAAESPATGLASGAVPTQSDDDIDEEVVFWNSIRDSDSTASFEEYLDNYPGGMFANLASDKLRSLRMERGCGDLSGEWIVRLQSKSCFDRIRLDKQSEDAYSMQYQICGAMGAVTNVRGTGEFTSPILETNWTSFPCGGRTDFEFDETCKTGAGRVISRTGLPGVCDIFVSKGVVLNIERAAN